MATMLTKEVTEFVNTGPLADNGAIVFRQPDADPRLPQIMSAILLDKDLYEQQGEPDIIHVAIEYTKKE